MKLSLNILMYFYNIFCSEFKVMLKIHIQERIVKAHEGRKS